MTKSIARAPAIGDSYFHEGHRYTVTEFSESRGILMFKADRPTGLGKGDTPLRFVIGNSAELQWAEDLGAWYLPLRCAPRRRPRIEQLVELAGNPARVRAFNDAVTTHPLYEQAGRDDLAEAAMAAVFFPHAPADWPIWHGAAAASGA